MEESYYFLLLALLPSPTKQLNLQMERYYLHFVITVIWGKVPSELSLLFTVTLKDWGGKRNRCRKQPVDFYTFESISSTLLKMYVFMKNSKVMHISSLGLATISPIFAVTLPFLSLFVSKQAGIFRGDPLVKTVMEE